MIRQFAFMFPTFLYFALVRRKRQNACATRVSIALIKSGMELRKEFMIQDGATDEELKKWYLTDLVDTNK